MCRKRILCLFDVDGTLTKPRNRIEPHLEEFLYNKVKAVCTLGLVGGSDLKKIAEQMNGPDVIKKFDYVFPENGLIQYKDGVLIGQESIQRYTGEEKLQKFINFCLGYLSKITLPVKRGTFIEFRTGMLNVSPIGRSCSQTERDDFEKYDRVHHIRKNMIEVLKLEFPNIGLTYSIGGQISFDVYPNGWDKTYCLQHLENEGFEQVHFFGDKTDVGGNDYEIFHDTRTIGHKVMNPDDTKLQLIYLIIL